MTTTVDDVLSLMRRFHVERGEIVMSAPMLAEELPISRRETLDRLKLARAAGDVDSVRLGAKCIAWWIPELVHIHPPEETPDETPDVDELKRDEQRDEIDELLEEWRPGRSYQERHRRREAAREALEWLRDQGTRESREDFIREVYPDVDLPAQNEDTFWKNTIRPALNRAKERGLVVYRPGHYDYKWVESGNSESHP